MRTHAVGLTRSGALAAGALALGTLLSAGEPASPPEPRLLRAEALAPGDLDPFILTNLVSTSIVVEIDHVAGFDPSPAALRAIERGLGEHCEEGKHVQVRLDDEIPLPVLKGAVGRAGLERLVARFLDADPRDWNRTETIYVLYAPDSTLWYGRSVSGMADRIVFSRDGEVASVRTILLFTDEIRRDAAMWITAAKVERATLVHELGHLMGLVVDGSHVQRGHPGHCRVARCVMHQPGARAGLVNGISAFFAGRIPSRYGKRCVRDIEDAKRRWRDGAAVSPEFVRRLKAERRFRQEADAEAWRSGRKGE